MEIQNAGTTPSKSNKLQNLNTLRWESGNVTAQPWEINNRKSEVIAFSGKKVSHESKRYRKCLFGISRIVHRDICTFILVFSHGNKSRAGQGAP